MTTRFAQRFVLEREIGSGGMARVFLGKDAVLERSVAIKILKPGRDETDVAARFRREGRTAARLSHPNIVQVYDAGEGELDGREASYIVMEYVPGGDLKDLIDEKGPLSNEELARLGAGIAAGLAHAHERGIIHRDVKPHNVLLDGGSRPKLTDFGIARALDATQATRTGSYLGTALYSSPEQLRGERVTPKSDVYSLGVTFYQAATGEPPFTGSPLTVAHQHVSEPPRPPNQINGSVSEDMNALILACLDKDPDNRPTADEVRIRLLEAGRGTYPTRVAPAPPVPAEPPPAEPPPADTGRTRRATQTGRPSAPPFGERREDRRPRRRAPILLALAALLLVLVGVAYATTLGGNTDTAQTNNPPAQNADQPAKNEPDNQQSQSGGQDENRDPAQRPDQAAQQQQPDQPAQQQNPPAQEQQEPPAGDGQGDAGSVEPAAPTPKEAAQTVREHYEVAASDNYQDAWNFLSSRFQREIGSQADYTDQFATFERVVFTEGPMVIESSTPYTATVRFSTIATHTYGTETRSGTATLVVENGEWKIDSISVA